MKWTLLKNFGYLALSVQAANFFQFIFFIYFARSFGDLAVGKYSFAFSFAYVFSVLADLGVSVYLTCEIAKTPSDYKRLFARGFVLRLFSLSILAVAGTITVAVFFGDMDAASLYTLVFLGLYQLFCSVADLFLAELKGHDKMGLVAFLNLLVRVLIASTSIVLIWLGFNYLWVLSCFPVCALIYAGACIASSVHLFGGTGWNLFDLRISRIFREALPFAFALMFMEVMYNIDTLLLRAFADDQTVGIYSVAQRIVMIFPGGILACVFTALLPTFSRLYVESRTKLSELAGLSLRYLVLAGLPISTGLFAISRKAVVFLFSEKFASASGGMQILSWTVVLAFAATTSSLLLTASGRQKAKSAGIGICLGANIGVNCFLIPRIGWEGAAWSRLIAEAMHIAIVGCMAARLFAHLSWMRVLVKPAASCLVMYILIRQLEAVNIIWVIPIGAAAYLGSLAMLQGFEKDEVEWMSWVMRRVGAMVGWKGLERL